MELKNHIKKHYNKKVVIKLKDMKNFFSDKASIKARIKENPLIYTVWRLKEKASNYSLTLLEPGKIGKEHFMTRGHYHKRPYPEIYILLKGKVLFIEQNKKIRTIKFKKNVIYYLEPGYAHRTVNIGNTRTELLTIESSKAGHTYKEIEKKGFRKKF